MEIDPDIRLASRLTGGGRWTFWLNVASAVTFVAFTGPSGRISRTLRDITFGMSPSPWPVQGDPGLHSIALITVMLAPFGVVRLVDLETRGLLDHLRMCGRRPERLLLAWIAGSGWPSIAFAAVLMIANAVLFGISVRVVWVAALLCLLHLDLGLAAIRLFPRFASLPVALFPLPVYWIAVKRGWLAADHIGADQMIVAAAVVLTLPLALRAAVRVVDRPLSSSGAGRRLNPGTLAARLVPRVGPPEFLRQVRIGFIQQGWLFATLAAIFAGLVGTAEYGARAGWGRGPVMGAVIWSMATPWLIVLFAAVTVGRVARLEDADGSLDLVRLTSQKPEAIAAGWFAGISLPFWILAAAAGAALAAVPDVFAAPPQPYGWWRLAPLWGLLVAPALVAPALALFEAVQRRPPLSYFAYAGAAVGVLLFGLSSPKTSIADANDPAIKSLGEEAIASAKVMFGPALNGTSLGIVVALALAVLLGAAAGRTLRRDGPALAGAAAAAAVLAVAWSIHLLLPAIFAIVAVAAMPLLASFVAEDRFQPSAPAVRLLAAVAACGAAGGVALVAGVEPLPALEIALASGCALGAALLAHELVAPWTFPALAIPIVMMAGIMRRPAPPVVLTAAAFAIAALLHTARRRTSR